MHKGFSGSPGSGLTASIALESHFRRESQRLTMEAQEVLKKRVCWGEGVHRDSASRERQRGRERKLWRFWGELGEEEPHAIQVGKTGQETTSQGS